MGIVDRYGAVRLNDASAAVTKDPFHHVDGAALVFPLPKITVEIAVPARAFHRPELHLGYRRQFIPGLRRMREPILF